MTAAGGMRAIAPLCGRPSHPCASTELRRGRRTRSLSNTSTDVNPQTACGRGRPWSCRACTRPAPSVFALDDEVRATDGAGELGLLADELEAVGELRRHLHPVGQLEADGPLP